MIKQPLILMIDFYQRFLSFDSGLLRLITPGGGCKHYPSCSSFTKEVIKTEGVLIGLTLGLKRILNCR